MTTRTVKCLLCPFELDLPEPYTPAAGALARAVLLAHALEHGPPIADQIEEWLATRTGDSP